jgi:hypothetical protein
MSTNKMIKVIHNVETGEILEREFNAEELAQLAKDKQIEIARQEVEAIKTAEKQALLDRIGITADEAKLLFS